MRVFLTGATGFIGSAIVPELLGAGHEVLGLARSDAAGEALARLGVEAHRGELADPESLAAAARACDGVIHTAYIHDFSQYAANAQIDRLALEAMAGAMEGTGKPLVAASGTLMVSPGRTAMETDPASEGSPRFSEVVLSFAERGVRASVVRLSPTVHGRGDKGFIPQLIDIARRVGFAAFVGDGANRWPAVHRLDAARLFRLALEKAAPGARLHGVGEEGVAMREIAQTIGEGVGVPVRGIDTQAAFAHFDWMATFVGLDSPASNAITRQTMAWRPEQAGLLADMRDGGYFG